MQLRPFSYLAPRNTYVPDLHSPPDSFAQSESQA